MSLLYSIFLFYTRVQNIKKIFLFLFSFKNVIFQTINNTTYRTPVSAPRKRMPQSSTVKGDFDTVNIQGSRITQDEDETFARILARRTAAQLGSGASAERVQELGRQVADGTYQPDAQRIAGRMLGLS